MRLTWLVVPALCGVLLGHAAVAQAEDIAEDIDVQFGFAGEIVADAWNPLRVTMRDLGSAELLLELDVGDLRSGTRMFRYSAPLAGGRGLYTFADDVYLPAWRTFSWLVRTPEQVLASGTVERRFVDDTPLELVLAREVGAGNDYFGEAARVVDVTAADLTERAASYSGVGRVLVLPGTAPPTPGTLVAAATAGSTVLLLGRLGAGYEELLALAPAAGQRLGAGWLGRSESESREAVRRLLSAHPRLVPATLLEKLVSDEVTAIPAQPGVMWPLAGLVGYAVLIPLLLRFGGVPGVLAALLLAGVLSAGAARVRPAEPLLSRTRSLHLGSGGLGLELSLEVLFSYAADRAEIDRPAYPLPVSAVTSWTTGTESFRVELDAYKSVVVAGKPRLVPALFRWSGASLVNETGAALFDVFVSNGGRQQPIAAGGAVRPGNGNLLPQELYAELAPLLPQGSAFARGGSTVYVALPDPATNP